MLLNFMWSITFLSNQIYPSLILDRLQGAYSRVKFYHNRAILVGKQSIWPTCCHLDQDTLGSLFQASSLVCVSVTPGTPCSQTHLFSGEAITLWLGYAKCSPDYQSPVSTMESTDLRTVLNEPAHLRLLCSFQEGGFFLRKMGLTPAYCKPKVFERMYRFKALNADA